VTDPVPTWIHKRDGRLVPFEADKISRSLFAATESLGRPDAFLARELADSVVHFLLREGEGAVPTTAQVAELTVKVVRELGQPALAQLFADHAGGRKPGQRATADRQTPPSPTASAEPAPVLRFPADASLPVLLDECRRLYTLRHVFARDLVAAHGEGLLTLTGLDAPFELAGCIIGSLREADGTGLVETLEAARQVVGGFVVLDGPEYLLARTGAVAETLRELAIGLRATGLRAVVNLNCAVPPSWADDRAEAPLFAGTRRALELQQVADLADNLRERLPRIDPEAAPVRVDWHLGERDFARAGAGRLTEVARAALDGAAVAFAFDRPRHPVPLAEGIDRQHPAVLLTVELHLPRLAEHVRSGPAGFLQKLGSLVRLALSAAVQKRDFLRRCSQERPAVTRGFLLDRARLVAAPVGLDAAVEALLGRSPWDGGPALEYARQVLEALRDVLRQDSRSCGLDTCLDGSTLSSSTPRPEEDAAVTPGPPAMDGRSQLRTVGALHTAVELGTTVVLLDPERWPAPEQVVEWLRWAWQHTDVTRVRLVRRALPGRQLTVPWPEERS
jgi:hypothetical protein